jgi:4-amino-4-deoxy-L-arabinose transferase-like glycosyltransferase
VTDNFSNMSYSNTYRQEDFGNPIDSCYFESNRYLLWLTLLSLFLLAFAVRVYFYGESRAVGEVQYRSAVIARAFYFERANTIPEWRREVNDRTRQGFVVKEPSVTEYLTALTYLISGGESMWLARLMTTVFWLIGGVFLFLIARNLVSVDAAVFTTAYYLFVPIGIFLSTSFQPDSLMIMLYLVSVFTIVQYGKKPSRDRLIIAAIVSGLAILVKPLTIFTLFAGFIFVAGLSLTRNLGETVDKGDIYDSKIAFPLSIKSFRSEFISQFKLNKSVRKTLIDILIFSFLLLIIGTMYYVYGILVSGQGLETQASVSFVPRFLMEREYWRGWLLTATGAVGLIPLALALLGIPLLRPGIPRALVVGLWFGYLIFCLVFTFHIHFNQYYHSQLFPIVALSLGGVSAILFKQLRLSIRLWYWWAPVIVSILMIALFTARDVRALFNNQAPIESQQIAWEIGELVNHSTNTVLIASYYGRPLMYMAEISGTYWPRRITSDQLIRDPGSQEQSVQERLDSLGF